MSVDASTGPASLDAWDGRVWEQEQPLAVLLGDIGDTQPASQATGAGADDEAATDFVLLPSDGDDDVVECTTPTPGPATAPAGSPDHDAGVVVAAKKRPPRKKRTRTSPKTKTTTAAAVRGDVLRWLWNEEAVQRRSVREEEGVFRRSLQRHRRDDREFWQLIVRQRERNRRVFDRDWDVLTRASAPLCDTPPPSAPMSMDTDATA